MFPTFEWREKVTMLLQLAVSPRLIPNRLKLLTKLKKLSNLDDRVEGSLVPGLNPTKPWPAALPSPVLEEDSTVSDGKKFFFFVFSLICRNIALKYVPKTMVNSSTSLDL